MPRGAMRSSVVTLVTVLAALDAAYGRRTRLHQLGKLLLGDAQLDAAADDLTRLGRGSCSG